MDKCLIRFMTSESFEENGFPFLFQGKHLVTKKTLVGIISYFEDDGLHPDWVPLFTTPSPKTTIVTESNDEFEMIDETLINAEEEATNLPTLPTFRANESTTKSTELAPTVSLTTASTQSSATRTNTITTAPTLPKVIDNDKPTIPLPVPTIKTTTNQTTSTACSLPNDGLIYYPRD